MSKEIERKFLFIGEVYIPEEVVPSCVVQCYLNRADRLGIECRVREECVIGNPIYSYTEKTRTKYEGVRGEYEEEISKARYLELLSLYSFDPSRTITKKRYKIELEEGLVLELDEYENTHSPLYIGEVEFNSIEEMESFSMPHEFGDYRDVTSDSRYSNASLAELGLPT